jgi:glycerol-3-phosphate cytidylyltransferase
MMYKKLVGFTAGAFDLLHPGHIYFLDQCKKKCNYLIIGLHVDPSVDRPEKNKPIQSSYERYVQLAAIKSVDKIVPYDSELDLHNMLATLNASVRFLGSDYINMDFTAKEFCNQLNIQLVYVPRMHTYSSSELRERLSA